MVADGLVRNMHQAISNHHLTHGHHVTSNKQRSREVVRLETRWFLCCWWVRLLTTITPYAWWRHPMESFSALLAICAGNSPVPVKSPHKDQWRGALMFLICAWINGWVSNREAGDLRRHRDHYDVLVMDMTWSPRGCTSQRIYECP